MSEHSQGSIEGTFNEEVRLQARIYRRFYGPDRFQLRSLPCDKDKNPRYAGFTSFMN